MSVDSMDTEYTKNVGLICTTSEIIVTFDTGTKYCDEWLKHMLRPFWEDPEMHVVDGVTVGTGETLFQKLFCSFYTRTNRLV